MRAIRLAHLFLFVLITVVTFLITVVTYCVICVCLSVAGISGAPKNFVRGEGGQQIQLRTERTGIWEAVAP
jgi:hypothetical protein